MGDGTGGGLGAGGGLGGEGGEGVLDVMVMSAQFQNCSVYCVGQTPMCGKAVQRRQAWQQLVPL